MQTIKNNKKFLTRYLFCAFSRMLRHLSSAIVALFFFMLITAVKGEAQTAPVVDGEKGFSEHCAECHSGGGNLIVPSKTLSRMDREKNGIRSAEDIVRLMRNPNGEMTAFDEKTVSEKDAEGIAQYILNTFR